MDDNNIIKHYIEDEMPLLKISRMYATTHYTIRKILKKHNIPLRNKGTKLGSISVSGGGPGTCSRMTHTDKREGLHVTCVDEAVGAVCMLLQTLRGEVVCV